MLLAPRPFQNTRYSSFDDFDVYNKWIEVSRKVDSYQCAAAGHEGIEC